MKYFLGAVGLVTLVLGARSENVMLVAVRERTCEIGACAKRWARGSEILRQFF
jgi:hypothetical protein